jgi:hypothetical protein
MATNPDPNYMRSEPQRTQDPDLAPIGKGGRPFPWGLVAAIVTIIAVAAIIWYFR